MTRIAFAADLHVDQYGTRVDAATGMNARLLDYLRTTRWVADQARECETEALVVAGDFTERWHVNDWLLRHLQDALADGPKVQGFLQGNHDPEIAGESKVTVLGEMGAGWRAFTRPGHLVVGNVVVSMLPYLGKSWIRTLPEFATAPPADVFRVLAEQFVTIARGLYAASKRAHPDKAAVLVCHQTLAGGQMNDSQRAFLGDQQLVVDAGALQAIGFEAVVAGHLHRHQVVIPGDRPVLYAGSIERVDFGEQDETKGFIVADVGPGRFEWEFVETPARRYVTITDPTTIGQALDSIEGSIVRARFDEPVDTADVRRWLEEFGAFEVTEVTAGRGAAPAVAGGLSETLTVEQALESYFEGDPDREAITERGRRVLAGVG